MVNLVQPANLREPRSNRKDETTASLDTPSPKWVCEITSRQSALDDVRGSHTRRSPIPEESLGLTNQLIVKTQRYRLLSKVIPDMSSVRKRRRGYAAERWA